MIRTNGVLYMFQGSQFIYILGKFTVRSFTTLYYGNCIIEFNILVHRQQEELENSNIGEYNNLYQSIDWGGDLIAPPKTTWM